MSSSGVPGGWVTASINDVATSSGGSTPSKSDPSYWTDGDIPWVSPKDMKTFDVRSSEDLVTEKALARLTKIPVDSVLMVVRSGILARTLPVAINAVPVTINQDMRAFVPEKEIDPKFVAWQLIADEREILSACSKDGTTVASIEGPALSAFPLKIAPASEQTRIVAKLEELLSDLDAGVAELKAAQRKLASLRQSLLKAAVEGALTADWRAARHASAAAPRPSSPRRRGSREVGFHATSTSMDSRLRGNDGQKQDAPAPETGADLLQRILTERRARWEAKQLAKFAEQGKTPSKDWQAKYPKPVAPDSADLPALPEGWVWSSLGQCFHVAVGATPSRKEPDYWGGDIPWVSSGEVRFNRIANTNEQISELGLSNTSTQINPIGSVLLGMIGEGKTRGQVAILEAAAANNQNCAAIWASETDVSPEFVYYWLWSRYEETRKGSSGNNQPALNKSIVENIPFPLPPLPELKAIVDLADASLSQAAQQQSAIDHALKQAAAQRKNLLKAAFAGQLVPQDPNDEPASELLARIRAQRAAKDTTTTSKRGRKAKESA